MVCTRTPITGDYIKDNWTGSCYQAEPQCRTTCQRPSSWWSSSSWSCWPSYRRTYVVEPIVVSDPIIRRGPLSTAEKVVNVFAAVCIVTAMACMIGLLVTGPVCRVQEVCEDIGFGRARCHLEEVCFF